MVITESDQLLYSGRVVFGEGAPELNWPNVPQMLLGYHKAKQRNIINSDFKTNFNEIEEVLCWENLSQATWRDIETTYQKKGHFSPRIIQKFNKTRSSWITYLTGWRKTITDNGFLGEL